MRSTVLSSCLLLVGCCMGSATQPAPTGPSGPAAPGCPDLAATIVGTWARDGFTEEYRADGAYVINGHIGTFRWIAPGRATLDVPESGFHEDYDLALADPGVLLAVGAGGVGTVYTRSSAPPSIPPECFDLRTAFAGTWLPNQGGTPERYDATGRYAVVGEGRWSFPAAGRLHLERDDGATSDYLVGMASTTTALAVSLAPLPPSGVAYTRGGQ